MTIRPAICRSMWMAGLLALLAVPAFSRELLQEVGHTIVPLEGKDLAQFVSSEVMKTEERQARSRGLVPEFLGHGTAYSTAVPDATAFACSNREIPPKAQKLFAAINSEQWDEGEHCGRCVKVWCQDSFCHNRFQPQILKVYDLCPECSYGDLDLSHEAYELVTGRWPHRLQIGWEFLSREECNEVFDHGTQGRRRIEIQVDQLAFMSADALHGICQTRAIVLSRILTRSPLLVLS